METNLGDIIDRKEQSDHPALIDLSDPSLPQSWTTSEMCAGIDRIARALLKEGFRQGDRIALLAANRAEYLLAYLAIMRSGFVVVPISNRFPASTIAFILGDSDAVAVIVDDEASALLPVSFRHFTFEELASRGAGEEPLAAVEMDDRAIAQILYTSGSTGRPKGVPLTHDGQLWAISKMDRHGPPFSDRLIIAAPLYHMNGLLFSKIALRNKMMIVLLPKFTARAYLEAVATYRCTFVSGIPTMFALMARELEALPPLDLGCVSMAMMGSAPLTQALASKVREIFPNAAIVNGYGTTEAGPFTFGPHPKGLPRPALSIGYPYPDAEIRLAGSSAPAEGVLHVRTRATTPGYLNLPEESAKRIKDGWYDTGDILRRDENGFYFFVGRADDMFVCGGENVYPGEVEKLIESHPDVSQAIVVPVSDEIKGQIPVAFVVPHGGASGDEEAIKAFTLREGPAFRHPRRILFRTELPLSGPGKVDRKLLAREAAEAVAGRRW